MNPKKTRMSWQRRQLGQTIIGTGVIGLIIGLLPLMGVLVLGSRRIVVADHARPLLLHMLDGVLFLLASVVFCIVLFGLLPMALQYAFIRGVRWWTGRD